MNILTSFSVAELQSILGYEFNNPELLDIAFTHSSTANLFGYESNERLEFFGDSILSFVVSEKLYHNSKSNEGGLSHIRASLVSAKNLSKIIDKMDLIKYYGVNSQIVKMGFPINTKADLFESILCAIYLDGGLEQAKAFIYKWIDLSPTALEKDLETTVDSKTRLQEYMQADGKRFEYKLLSQSGPAHSPTFEVALYVEDEEIAHAKAKTKREAEHICANTALEKFVDN